MRKVGPGAGGKAGRQQAELGCVSSVVAMRRAPRSPAQWLEACRGFVLILSPGFS